MLPDKFENTGHGKFMKQSAHYNTTERGVECMICPNRCILQEGGTGICRTHVVHENRLYTSAYGNPCSVHVDPVEKKPLFHFLPASGCFSIATAGCNLGCQNCQNWEISQCAPSSLTNLELFPQQVVDQAMRLRCLSVAYTYTEPTVFYEYMFDTAVIARDSGIKNLMISNGYINERPLRDLCRYLDAANIDLKSFSDQTYAKVFRGKLQPVLDTLQILKDEGVWLEITNLLIPGVTDQPDQVAAMCEWLAGHGFSATPMHFSRFHPMHQLTGIPATPHATLINARTTALSAGMRYVYIGNVPGGEAENTYCPSCKKKVVERHGFSVGAIKLSGGACSFCGTVIDGVWE